MISPILVVMRSVTYYQSSLSANCICRGVLACEVITPKVVEVTLVFGEPKRGVLKALSASTRNWTFSFSNGENCLKSEKSKFFTPSFRTSGSVAPTFPKVNGAG